MKKLVCLASGLSLSLLAAACGDNNNTGPGPDASTADAPPDTPSGFVAPTPVFVPVAAAAGRDQLLGVTAGPDGTFYATGFRAATHEPTADTEIVVVKLTADGTLDPSFSTDGIATHNVAVAGGGELARGIVVQPSGKIVVLGQVEDEVTAADRDAVLLRFHTDGSLDTTFGVAGVARLDLNTAIDDNGTLRGADAPWGLAVDGGGKLLVHAAQRAEGLDTNGDPHLDTDFAVVRLTVDGLPDATFGTAGKFLLDIQRSSASVRGLAVLPNGSVIAGGYANSSGLGTTQPVVYKLTSAGVLDATFATAGLFHETVLPFLTEVYAVSLQGTSIVTAGYGRAATGDKNDWVSLRFTAAGALDTTWGADGAVVIDPTMMDIADNCRNVLALPGGRTALIGSSGVVNDDSDAQLAILTSTGALDTEFGSGIMKFDIGGNDALWSGAVSSDGSRALFVGFKGGGLTPSATTNDDSHVVVLPLE